MPRFLNYSSDNRTGNSLLGAVSVILAFGYPFIYYLVLIPTIGPSIGLLSTPAKLAFECIIPSIAMALGLVAIIKNMQDGLREGKLLGRISVEVILFKREAAGVEGFLMGLSSLIIQLWLTIIYLPS